MHGLIFSVKIIVDMVLFLDIMVEFVMQVFSFKLRGAYNMMVRLSREQLDRGVICSSAGNHAQGVALAAQKLGCDALIVMPVTTPEIKVSESLKDHRFLVAVVLV